MKMACFKVAVFDRFPDWQKCRPGGNAMNQSVRFAQMGWNASFVGALGSDREGDLLLQALNAYGVDCTFAHRMEGKTASNRLLIDENGERFEAPGAWQGGVYETYSLSPADWAYLEQMSLWVSHANHSDYFESLDRKKDGQFFAVDFLHFRDMALLIQSLPAVNLAFFGGTLDMVTELSNVARHFNAVVVLTLGAAGSMAFHGDEVFHQKALPVEKVADTTGCGDAYQAAFTNSFYRFRDVPRALYDGAKSGQATCRKLGALAWPDNLEHLADALF